MAEQPAVSITLLLLRNPVFHELEWSRIQHFGIRSGTNVILSSGTCWDVSSKATLTHGGGGDTQAISNMIKYAISQYKVDASRVYVTGGSSGGGYRNFVWPSMRGFGCRHTSNRALANCRHNIQQ